VNHTLANRKILEWQSGYGVVSFGTKARWGLSPRFARTPSRNLLRRCARNVVTVPVRTPVRTQKKMRER
jgi:hypothetical protein